MNGLNSYFITSSFAPSRMLDPTVSYRIHYFQKIYLATLIDVLI